MNSSEIAIKVENISKLYRIGLKEEIQDSFVITIFNFIKRPFANYRKYQSLYKFNNCKPGRPEGSKDNNSIIWALNDVSFDVKQGEVIGIIGRNGAGKSTLLKILSRITDPTYGHAEIRGRVSSLLEVGTGFHPELTGRENIYLNATILGMTKKEVDYKFDQIVEFSGVEKFLDTPVKRYSSGMRVRLAFSVAAHLEPEILIIDEVLAVGDIEFQKKCLGKMDQIAKEGRTVVFVSHNMAAVTQLCTHALLLENGRVTLSGPPPDVVSSYLSLRSTKGSNWFNAATNTSDIEVYIKSVRILSEEREETSVVEFNRKFNVEIAYTVIKPTKHFIICCRLADSLGNILWTSWDTDTADWDARLREPGDYLSKCEVPGNIFRPNHYILSVGSLIPGVKLICMHESILTLDISDVGYPLNNSRKGIVTPLLEWEIKREERDYNES